MTSTLPVFVNKSTAENPKNLRSKSTDVDCTTANVPYVDISIYIVVSNELRINSYCLLMK